MNHLVSRFELAMPSGRGSRSWGEVMAKAFGRGVFVHHSILDANELVQPCGICGGLDYVAYCERDTTVSDGDDAFECIDCGAVRTRRDAYGFHAWVEQGLDD